MGARGWARTGWVALLAIGAACIPPREIDQTLRGSGPAVEAISVPSAPAPVAAPRGADEGPAVVLVVLDGVRWQEVFVGSDPALSGAPAVSARALMPQLHRLVAERGAAVGAPGHGPPIGASGPNFVSLPGYTEILTGRGAHGCADNDCDRTRTPTVMDEARAVSAGPTDVAVFSSWDRIERAASVEPGGFVLSTGRSHLAHAEALREDDVTSEWLERGAAADAFPGSGDFRPDRFTGALALRYLETKRPRLMFLGLGEPDEYCHRDDYRGYLASLRASDAVLGDLFTVLDRMGERGRRTTVIVTADHGRGRDYRHHGRDFPESSRVWLAALGAGVEARGFARSVRPHRLADVAPTVRALLALPADTAASAGAPLEELLAPTASLASAQP